MYTHARARAHINTFPSHLLLSPLKGVGHPRPHHHRPVARVFFIPLYRVTPSLPSTPLPLSLSPPLSILSLNHALTISINSPA